MVEQGARGPEQNEVVEVKKGMLPGERVQGLIQNPENPLVAASKVKELTGIDSPATMAIEIGDGQERRRLLVVPVEHGVKSDQGVQFNADVLLVDPNLVEFDERGPIGGFGLKGLNREERVAFSGDSRRVDQKLDLVPGRDPSFMVSVSRTGSLDIMVHPNSPAEIRLIFPDVTKKEAPAGQPAPEVPTPQETSLPIAPPESITQRLAPTVETEHAEQELTADEIFASPEAFMDTLNKKDLGQATRIELLHIMSASEKRLSVQQVTALWESGLGESLKELSPSAQAAFAESYQLEGMFSEFETMSRSSLSYPEEMPQNLGRIEQMAQQVAQALDQAEQSDTFLEKTADFMQHDDRLAKVQAALETPLIVDDPTKVDALVAAHVRGEDLGTMRQRLDSQLQEEPGYEAWHARKQAMAVLAHQEPRTMTNREYAHQIRLFLDQFRQSPEDALSQFINLGGMGDIGHKIRSTLQRAQSIGSAA